jgi:hypothetical protein
MTPGDEMTSKTEPNERLSADNQLKEQLRATLNDFQRASLQPQACGGFAWF